MEVHEVIVEYKDETFFYDFISEDEAKVFKDAVVTFDGVKAATVVYIATIVTKRQAYASFISRTKAYNKYGV